MKIAVKVLVFALSLVGSLPVARAQSLVTTLVLGPNEIGEVRTAPGITTRISFAEKVAESVCGDLYDASSGRGIFVIQASGNDVFLKPIASKGMSNLFVKTGDNGKNVYNIDLKVVAQGQAHRVVNVVAASGQGVDSGRNQQTVSPTGSAPPISNGAQETSANTQPAGEAGKTTSAEEIERARIEGERIKTAAEQAARKTADEIIRNAQQQANRIIGEAENKLSNADRQASARVEQEAERRFMQSLMLGLREDKIDNTRVVVKKIIVTLDPRVLIFDERSFLRYTIQNTSRNEFTFNAIILEAGTDDKMQALSIQISQSKTDNKLGPGESLAGVISYDAKLVGPKDRLVLTVLGEDNTEVARMGIR